MANVCDVDDFVEQLSNCIGEISGNEVVFKKIPYSSEYVVRMRNHNEKVANIWYDYDKDKIIVQLIPAFRNMEYSLDDLTIENIKGIGQMVRKNALNRIGESMEFEVAKKILNENGYVLKERFVNVDEIHVPEWLWVAYETGDTSNLEDEEIVILHNFEKEHKNHHLEANEEPNFYNRNDVTDEGGMCYTVQVFEDRIFE